MKLHTNHFLVLAVILYSSEFTYADEGIFADSKFSSDLWLTIKDDHKEFYSRARLIRMGVTASIGASLSTTSADQSFQSWYQNDVRSAASNDLADVSKNFGDYRYILPAIVITGIADRFVENHFNNSMVGDWGKRSMRAYLLGTPLLWTSQVVTGASRPGENSGSDWRPFSDNNGVSGHAFTGAVPFLTLARLNEDNKFLKYFFYAASTLTAFSRINDDAHYLSQAALGWYLAWEATDTIADNEYAKERLMISALPIPDGYGLQVGMRW